MDETLRGALIVVSGIVMILGFFPYIWAILKGLTQPNKTSWLIWTTLDVTTLIIMLRKNSQNGIIIGATIGATVVSLLSLKYGELKWSRIDKVCLGGAAIGIVLFLVFNSPNLALISCMLVFLIGTVPTVLSAWKDPSKESLVGWTLFWISCVLSTIAIPAWTTQDAAQPITFLIIESTMMFILLVRPRMIES